VKKRKTPSSLSTKRGGSLPRLNRYAAARRKSGAGARLHYHSHTLDITVALNRDSAASDQLVDECDYGDDQQYPDQTAAHVSYQSQQPEHEEYYNNRPQHCFFLLLSQVLERDETSHFQEPLIEAQRAYRKCLEFIVRRAAPSSEPLSWQKPNAPRRSASPTPRHPYGRLLRRSFHCRLACS
jgi:hypothetical protein